MQVLEAYRRLHPWVWTMLDVQSEERLRLEDLFPELPAADRRSKVLAVAIGEEAAGVRI